MVMANCRDPRSFAIKKGKHTADSYDKLQRLAASCNKNLYIYSRHKKIRRGNYL